MNRRFAMVAVLAIALGALPVLAQGRGQGPGGPGGRGPGGPGGPGGPPGGILGMVHQLDLTDTQKE
jgi:Spy/CpxP family protein refolding chaperone